MRLNSLGRLPSDDLGNQAALIAQKWDEQTERLLADIHQPGSESPGQGRLMHAFRLVCDAEPLIAKLKAAQKAGTLPAGEPDSLVAEARAAGVLSNAEAARVTAAREARLAAIEVDVFSAEEFFANAASAPETSRQAAA